MAERTRHVATKLIIAPSDGDPAPLNKGGTVAPPPHFSVHALWPNGWIDQDATVQSRPRPWPHCVRWGPSSPPPKGAQPPIFVHVCCSQTAAWIKMPLGTEVDFGPVDIVLDGDPALPKGTQPPNFRPTSVASNGS